MKMTAPCRGVAMLFCCTALLPATVGHAADPVAVVGLQISRPASLDPFNMPGTTISLEVSVPGQRVLGLGAASAITTLSDDTGHDLLADGEARESAVEAELAEMMSGMFGGGGTMTRKETGGNIDHERAASQVDRERSAVVVPVITLGLPARGAKSLRLTGELAVEVAAAGERRVRVQGVSPSPDWFVIEVELEGRSVSCNPQDYIDSDEGTVTVYYCGVANLERVEVVGERAAAPSGDFGSANLFVMRGDDNLTLDFVFPAQETVRVPVAIEFGIGF